MPSAVIARALFAALALALPATAAGDAVVLRLASAVPKGTAWAREGSAFARDVAARTHGQVRIKWYLDGVAGDELTVGDRIQRGQLDGIASGGMLCTRLAPSMRVTRVAGIFERRAELSYALGRLKPTLDAEFRRSGFANLWELPLGPGVLFTRAPVRAPDDLRHRRLWTWNLDETLNLQLRAAGVPIVPLPLEEAGRAYDDRRVDGFIAVPSAALMFQWSAQARYVTDLRLGFLTGCLLVANRAIDPLPTADRQALEAAAAKLHARLDALGAEQDAALLGGLFARQGLHTERVSEALRGQFYRLLRQAREQLGERLVPRALLGHVLAIVADYRNEHAGVRR